MTATPNCGYIGTVLTVGDDTLIYRDRTGRNPLDHIETNPKVIVLFRNTERDAGWKFRCTASVYREGQVFEDMTDRLLESGLVNERYLEGSVGAIVVLRIDQVLTPVWGVAAGAGARPAVVIGSSGDWRREWDSNPRTREG